MSLRILLILAIVCSVTPAFADTIKHSLEGGMDIQITSPNSIIIGRDFSVSILVENNGWEDKKDVLFVFKPDASIIPVSSNQIFIEKIEAGGSYGSTLEFSVNDNARDGIHFLNVDYSHVLLANNETPQNPLQKSIAMELLVKKQPKINIHTTTPESIFANAEFPFTVEIIAEDSDISDVTLQIVPPKDIEFRGETMHTFSNIQKDHPISITSRILTPTEEINTEYKIPFQVIIQYEDDTGEEKSDSKTVSIIMRPRTFFELTTDGGFWIGDFFIAPYVSLGTIIGIPVGTIISLAIRRSQRTKKKRKVKK